MVDKPDATGTYYPRNRSYDPSTARFTQEDPLGLAGGLNVYGFASGDPVNFSDPFGLCGTPDGGDDGKACPHDFDGSDAAAVFAQLDRMRPAMAKTINIATAVSAAPVVAAAAVEGGEAAVATRIPAAVERSSAGQFAIGFVKGVAASAQAPGTRVPSVTIVEKVGIVAGRVAGWAAKNPDKVAALFHRIHTMLR